MGNTILATANKVTLMMMMVMMMQKSYVVTVESEIDNQEVTSL